VRALIVFLSPPKRDIDLVREIVESKWDDANLADAEFRRKFCDSWRIPLEAIAYHAEARSGAAAGRLREVIVIPSADRAGAAGVTSGTYHDLPLFCQLLETLRNSTPMMSPFSVRGLKDLLDTCGVQLLPARDYSAGVDFESALAMVNALTDAYDALTRLDFPDKDILVDVTGGQKVPTVAGAVVALAEGRRFQYVSTHDYLVRTYDVTYMP
jgi:hypothetical protein